MVLEQGVLATHQQNLLMAVMAHLLLRVKEIMVGLAIPLLPLVVAEAEAAQMRQVLRQLLVLVVTEVQEPHLLFLGHLHLTLVVEVGVETQTPHHLQMELAGQVGAETLELLQLREMQTQVVEVEAVRAVQLRITEQQAALALSYSNTQ